ncbi:MAG: hypothetical protein RBS57_19850, partial [Desulforhabdus sp.]|nr:hypothetical protein [Desulforhabdus sp.]
PGYRFEGLEGIKEIIADPAVLFRKLKRVELERPESHSQPRTWAEVAADLAELPSVLCVVNRRDDCRQLWSLMPHGTYHLSALMCGAHRSRTISEIKSRLSANLPTRVIATQLVEAGVDLDFPVVYRAMAGLDSIAQAAGRCNREGLLKRGRLVVFVPPSQPPVGILRQAAGIASRLLGENEADPLIPERFTDFFRELYWIQGPERLDRQGILRDLKPNNELRFSFRTAAAKFKLIDDSQQAPVIVRYGAEGRRLVEMLEQQGPERWLLRRLQRYVVNLPRHLHGRLRLEGAIREAAPGVFIQGHQALYDGNLGFLPDKSMIYDPDELVA